MGHSVASLYRNASTACPLTWGSRGSWISLGTMSMGEGFFEDVVRDASILVRGLKGDAD
jgi:hypothetical protein